MKKGKKKYEKGKKSSENEKVVNIHANCICPSLPPI